MNREVTWANRLYVHGDDVVGGWGVSGADLGDDFEGGCRGSGDAGGGGCRRVRLEDGIVQVRDFLYGGTEDLFDD